MRNAECGTSAACGVRSAEVLRNHLGTPHAEFDLGSAFRIPHSAEYSHATVGVSASRICCAQIGMTLPGPKTAVTPASRSVP
jgi:hypothetical protein